MTSPPSLAAAGLMLALAATAAQSAGRHAAPADLTGLWTSSSLTMLERPAGVAALTVSEAEAPALEKRIMAADAEDIDDVGGRSSEIGWWDFGDRLARIEG